MKKTLALTAILWAGVLATSVSSVQAFPNGYTFRRSITIDVEKVSGSTNLSNFPLLFSGTYDYLRTTANGGKLANSSGYDIIFTADSSGEEPLDHEIEAYDPTTGQLSIWVEVPVLSGDEDTVIYLFHSNSSIAVSPENPSGVWDSGYKGVWHMDQISTCPDSTANNKTGTFVGTMPNQVNGKIGKAQSDSAVYTDRISFGNASLFNFGPMTLSIWAYMTGGDTLINKDWGSGYALYTQNGVPIFALTDQANGRKVTGTTDIRNGWHHIVGTYDGSTIRLYVDGEPEGTPYVYAFTYSGSAELYVGANNYGGGGIGYWDETRVSNLARPADWIKTSYANQSSPATFYALGEAEAIPLSPTGLEAEGETNPTEVTDLTPEFTAVYNDPNAADAAYYYQLQVGQLNIIPFSRSITIDNSANSVSLTDYQVKVTLAPANFDYAQAAANGADIRFWDSAGDPLSHWIENWQADGDSYLWVKIHDLTAFSSETVILSYGNPSLPDGSSGEDVFCFFDDFSGGAIDTSRWINTSGFLQSGGYLRGNNTSYRILSSGTWTGNYILETRQYTLQEAPNGHQGAGWYASSVNGYNLLLHPTNAWYTRNDGTWHSMGAYDYMNQWVRLKVAAAGGSSCTSMFRESDEVWANIAFDTNSGLSGEYLSLGQRNDDACTGQAYSAQWDWIFVRKYSAIEPVVTVNDDENVDFAWDSGRTEIAPLAEENRSAGIVWDGEDLSTAGEAYWWRIRFWDEAGNEGEWSEPAYFTMLDSTPAPPTELLCQDQAEPGALEVLEPVFSAVYNDPEAGDIADGFRVEARQMPEDVMGWWQFNEESGREVADLSGNANHGLVLTEDRILFLKYGGKSGHPSGHIGLVEDYNPADLRVKELRTEINIPTQSVEDSVNYLFTAWMWVETSGEWQFAIDGDDAVEVEVDGLVEASHYGGHGFCNCQDYNGSVSLDAGWHRITVRHEEDGGGEGVTLYYKAPGDSSWQIFSVGNLSGKARLHASLPTNGAVSTLDFIRSGISDLPGLEEGLWGGALSFDGTDDYITFPHIPLDNRDFSISAWIKLNAVGKNQGIVGQDGQDTESTNKRFHFLVGSNNQVQFCFYSNDLNGPDGAISAGQWYHVAATYSHADRDRRIYLNGELYAQDIASSSYLGATGDTLVGRIFSQPDESFDGLIDELQILHRTLPPEEVVAYYQAGEDYGLVWDSGEAGIPMSAVAEGARCSDIEYDGDRLYTDSSTYQWRIKFWDDSGNEGAWSDPAYFTMLDSIPLVPNDLQTSGWTSPTGVTDPMPEFSAIFNDPEAGDLAYYYQVELWRGGQGRYCREVIIDNRLGSEDLLDYQVEVALGDSNFSYSRVRVDGADLRFQDLEGNELAYWIEEWERYGDSTVWVKVPEIAAFSVQTIHLYYGNPVTVSLSERDSVFDPALAGQYAATFSHTEISPNHGAACDGTNFYISQHTYVNKFDSSWSFLQQYSGLDLYTGICWDRWNNRFYAIDWSNKEWSAFDSSFVESVALGLHDMFLGGEPIDCATDGTYLYTNHRNGQLLRNRISDNTQSSINMDALSGFDWGGQGLTYAFGYLFAGTSGSYGANGNRIYIIDVENWSNPDIKGYWSAAGHELTEVAGLTRRGRYIYQTARSEDYALKWQGPLQCAASEPTVMVNEETSTLVWDSGQLGMDQVEAGESFFLEYEGTGLLTDGSEYFWRIRFWDEAGNDGTWSDPAYFAMLDSIPTAPTDLLTEGWTEPTEVTDLTPEFTAIFNDPEAGDVADYYRLQVARDDLFTDLAWDTGEEWTEMIAVAEGERSSGLVYAGERLYTDGTGHYWRVRFRDAAGNESDWSAAAVFTMFNSIPAPATDLSCQGETDPIGVTGLAPELCAVFNDRQPGDSAVYYQVQAATDSGFGDSVWETGMTEMAELLEGEVFCLEWEGDPLIFDGAEYFWRIRFWDLDGNEGNWSPAASFTMVDYVQSPSAPTGLLCRGEAAPVFRAYEQPYFSAVYNDPDGSDQAVMYRIQVSLNSDFARVFWDSGDAGTTMANLLQGERCGDITPAGPVPAGAKYYWRIKFWDLQGQEGGWSEAASFTQVEGTAVSGNYAGLALGANVGGCGNGGGEKRGDATYRLVDSLGSDMISLGTGGAPYVEGGGARAYFEILLAALDTTVPSVPGEPGTESPTYARRPEWSWESAADNIGGSGIRATDGYRVYWSQAEGGDDFSDWADASTYTHQEDLGLGGWYFKVSAVDREGNFSAAASGSVLIVTPSPTPSVTPTATPSVTPTATPSVTPTASVVPTATPDGGCKIDLKVYLHGYLNEMTLIQRPATVNVEFRTTQSEAGVYAFDLDLDAGGRTGEEELWFLPPDSYYLLLRQKLPGGTFEGEEIPPGANHLAAVSSELRGFVEGVVTEVNFADEEDLAYLGVYVSSHPQASSPLLAVATEGRYWMLGGGDADGNRLINVADILKWDTLVGFPDADDRGEARFSEQGNYDGNDKIDGYDFNVWKRMVNEGVTYAPLPPE